uniref:Putative ovule protein n=1 Tax=Solanum chacoense TaxID=4108 RepID=A0A0V0GI77_SOLCH
MLHHSSHLVSVYSFFGSSTKYHYCSFSFVYQLTRVVSIPIAVLLLLLLCLMLAPSRFKILH